MSGVSWFGVDSIESEPSEPRTTHVQPEPKRFTPASLTCCLSAFTSPKAWSIASFNGPSGGSPPPSGLISCQKSEWL